MDKMDNSYPFWITLDNILDNMCKTKIKHKFFLPILVTKKKCPKWTFFGQLLKNAFFSKMSKNNTFVLDINTLLIW